MLDFRVALKQIETESLAPVITLVGTEFVLKRTLIDAVRQKLAIQTGSQPELARHYFDEEGCGSALLACQTLSLFSTSNFVLLDNFTAVLPSSKVKHDVEELEKYLENPVSESVLLLAVPGEKMDERKKLAKSLNKFPVVNCTSTKEEIGLGIVQELARKAGISGSKSAIRELYRRRPSITEAYTELQKMWTYTAGVEIQIEDVEELVTESPEDNVFTWIDSVVKGRMDLVFRTLADIRKAGYDTFALLAMLARQIRMMWFAKVLGDRGLSHAQIASQVGAHPYAIKVAAEQARKYTVKRLETLLTYIGDGEFAAKTGRRDAEQVLDFVVVSLAIRQ